ncbi:hypothetical protein OW763_15035 [Clostridium aestuarii]|uniref:Uncharacterized protein n=1 Tax=Clostridium aestuarii TaxID=338193 RepID=A0ABT4D322_9CLOT|nr:hypothetical protein [Clostridium aestuarii]MCY6485644.1 hypothetical protein [Clostridium aestuarii]
MLPEQPYFIFYIESITLSDKNIDPSTLSFLNKLSLNNCYFFTHNCDISRNTFYNKLASRNIPCTYSNVMTPSYLITNYYKDIYRDFSVYPISNSDDFQDLDTLGINIDYINPTLIFIKTKKIKESSLKSISKTHCPIVLSSNLCINRSLNCEKCSTVCIIKQIKSKFKERIIIPDMPYTYNSHNLFKQLNIQPKSTVVVTNLLRDDYIQYQRMGCRLILTLNNGTTFDHYLNSAYDADLVVDNFKNLATFLNK